MERVFIFLGFCNFTTKSLTVVGEFFIGRGSGEVEPPGVRVSGGLGEGTLCSPLERPREVPLVTQARASENRSSSLLNCLSGARSLRLGGPDRPRPPERWLLPEVLGRLLCEEELEGLSSPPGTG